MLLEWVKRAEIDTGERDGLSTRPRPILGVRCATVVYSWEQRGSLYQKRAEEWPFVKTIILPNCMLVGPHHRLEYNAKRWMVHHEHVYEDREVTDEEFVALLEPGSS